MSTGLTIAELRVRQLNDAKGFEITLEGEARVPHVRGGRGAQALQSRTRLQDGRGGERGYGGGFIGMVIYDVVWSLLDLADMAGVDLEAAFGEKARLNRSRQW